MDFIANRLRNPFDLSPPCEAFVPGFGDTDAHFHVIGDHPGVHGGLETGIPFTDRPWSGTFFEALEASGLLERIAWDSVGETNTGATPEIDAVEAPETEAGGPSEADTAPRADGPRAIETVVPDRTYFSYLHLCLPDDEPDYTVMEPFFDAELRAIVAHVLLPVGERATEHVLASYTARDVRDGIDMTALHATEVRGSGWLIIPIKDPVAWTDADRDALVQRLQAVLASDYRRESDLGRFIPGAEPYRVR